MSDDDVVTKFMEGYKFPDAAWFDPDSPRIWFWFCDDGKVVFGVSAEDGAEHPELLDIARAAIKAVNAAHPGLTLTFELEVE